MSPSEVDSTKELDKKSSQRRINKPLIEKRRRARINDSLAQLKSIVLEASDSQGPRPSKLEKADILEMTVDFIKKKTLPNINKGQYSEDPKVKDQTHTEYTAGYAKCLSEISKFLEDTRYADGTSKRLVEHISCKLGQYSSPSKDVDGADSSNGKIRIEPLRQHVYTDDIEKPQDPVDLSMRSQKSKSDNCDSDKTNRTQPLDKAMDMSSNGHVISQQVPVGLVCGSHIMLLVQIPSSTTSQQTILPQNVISLNPNMQTLSGMESATVSKTSVLPPPGTSAESWPEVLPKLVTGGIEQNKPDSTAEIHSQSANGTGSVKTEAEMALSEKVSHGIEEHQHESISGAHWRPW